MKKLKAFFRLLTSKNYILITNSRNNIFMKSVGNIPSSHYIKIIKKMKPDAIDEVKQILKQNKA